MPAYRNKFAELKAELKAEGIVLNHLWGITPGPVDGAKSIECYTAQMIVAKDPRKIGAMTTLVVLFHRDGGYSLWLGSRGRHIHGDALQVAEALC